MRSWVRRVLWLLGGFAVLLVVLTFGGGIYVRQQLRASLPVADGTLAIRGLQARVTIERDGLGVPVITGSNRADVARAIGFLHAQERFFQMDLQRRQAAGELAALVGERALEADRTNRIHRFRHVAQEAIARAGVEYRTLIDAYAEGVNAGLRALEAKPFEYVLLRAEPEDWRPEDSVLTVLAMFNTLQGRQAGFEATFGTLADIVPPPMYQFLTARGSEWDAPVEGDRFQRPSIPGPEVFDLRSQEERVGAVREPPMHCVAIQFTPECLSQEEAAGLGSNNWAVSGAHAAGGAALLANDMHLAINVPNIWYRASMLFPDPLDARKMLRVTGVTLPGVPSVVVGSNGIVAWGFTNTGGDWSDLVIVEDDPRDAEQYVTAEGPKPIQHFKEVIAIHGAAAQTVDVPWTIWGPIVLTDHRGRRLAQHWVAHDPDRLAADITGPEQARSIEDALRIGAGLGIPAQNFVAVDTTGRIGWTIAGPIPRREGFDGSVPTSWADGSRRWNGYLLPHEHPRIVDPPSGRIWTANAPVKTSALATVGEGGYADGIRARIIRDRLLAIDKAAPADMLSVQLDDTALFHERWRTLLLDLLTPSMIQTNPKRAEFRRLIETTWTGRADLGSAAYLLVRTFRSILAREALGAITDSIKLKDTRFDYTRTLRSEGPLWQLISERPAHLLNPKHETWEAQIVSAVDLAIAELTSNGQSLADRTWSTFNRAIVAHPLGGAVPLIGRFVNMPADALPGDIYTPRAHSPRAGPSERMVVSPGHEEEGILHMPAGQSGHPLSPHYADEHHAWISGEPLPFLPGATLSTLTLTPR